MRYFDHGLEIFNLEGTTRRFFEWADVERVEEDYHPPLAGTQLVLRDGERVQLNWVEADELASVLEQQGIPFDRRFGRGDTG